MNHSFAPAVAVLLAASGIAPSFAAEPAMTIATPNEPVAKTAPDLAATKPAVAASNAFGLDLFRTLAADEPDRNLFISPYSMSIALTMAAEGARGETETQMSTVLRFPSAERIAGRPITQIHAGYAALSRHFAAAAGNADKTTRDRINQLRKDLDSANAATAKLEAQEKWKEAGESQHQAETLASDLNTLLASVDRFDLRIANALWVDKSYDLAPAFVRSIGEFYGTGHVTPLDFAGQTEQSRRAINTWVEGNTENRIRELIPSGILSRDTCLVLTNAVYFLGQWTVPFKADSTREADFTLADGSTVKAKLMNDPWRGSVPYAAFTGAGEYFNTPRQVPRDQAQWPRVYPDDDGFSMIQLPYKGGDLAMVLIAPRTPAGLPALESRLTSDALGGWLNQLDTRAVDTAMPRFRLESAHELSDPLMSLGIKRAFTNPFEPGGAQFSGICVSEDPADQPYIGAVLHKAWVEVNEVGTEAAAATAVIMVRAGAEAQPREMVPFVPTFHADHPFLFLIRDTKSGVVLFIGRITNPAK